MMDRLHEAVNVKHPMTGELVPIDKMIVPLIEGLWKLGLRTRFSCEGQDRCQRIFVCFETYTEFQTFIRIVLDHEIAAGRSTPAHQPFRAIRSFGGGDFKENCWDASVHGLHSSLVGTSPTPDLGFAVGLYFPRRDLPRVQEAIDDACRSLQA